jgi:hypothetical protein
MRCKVSVLTSMQSILHLNLCMAYRRSSPPTVVVVAFVSRLLLPKEGGACLQSDLSLVELPLTACCMREMQSSASGYSTVYTSRRRAISWVLVWVV